MNSAFFPKVLLIFLLLVSLGFFGHCKVSDLEAPCDPTTPAYQITWILKRSTNDPSLFCGFRNLEAQSTKTVEGSGNSGNSGNLTSETPSTSTVETQIALSGRVKGLVSQSISLTSGTTPQETIVVNSGSTSFQFSGRFPMGTAFNIQVSQHSNGICYLVNGQGTISLTMPEISVVCVEPKNLTDLSAWYRYDSLSLSDGAVVPNWNDESPNANVLNGGGPTYSISGMNGKPTINFNGNSLATSTAVGLGGNSLTTFLVFKRGGVTGTEQFAFFMGDDPGGCPPGSTVLSIQSGGPGEIGMQTPCGAYILSPSPSIAIPDTDFSPKILSARYSYSPGNSRIRTYLDGESKINALAADSVLNTANPLFQFGDYGPGTRPFIGSISEFLYYRRPLTDTEMVSINCYLGKKYNFSYASTCQ